MGTKNRRRLLRKILRQKRTAKKMRVRKATKMRGFLTTHILVMTRNRPR